MQVELPGCFADQAGKLLLLHAKGFAQLRDLTGQAFLPRNEVGARSGHAGDGPPGHESLGREMPVETGHFFLKGDGEPRTVSDELVGLDEVSLTGTTGLGSLVDHASSSPVSAGLRAHAMRSGGTRGEVTCVNAGVQSAVSKPVGHRRSSAGAVFTAVPVGPFCPRIDQVVVGDEATDVADHFATAHVHEPVHSATVLTRRRMAVKGATWLVLGLIEWAGTVQLLNSLFNSGFPEYIIVRPNRAYKERRQRTDLLLIGASIAPSWNP